MILTLNAGSSSLKFAVFDGARAVLRGAFESVADAPEAHASDADGRALDPPQAGGAGHEAVLPALFGWLRERELDLAAVGHRIVHGGDRFDGPVRIDGEVLDAIEALTPLAPLHQGHAIAAVQAARKAEPGLPQVACFDTAFHRTLPPVARLLPLPARLGLRRYGFHGLSYEWIAGQLPVHLAQGRVIVAHLGSGASLCALHAGVSVETTMGTTPLDGLVMGTRCGALDPGVVLLLARERGVEAAERLLYHEAGLLGVSGESADMRALHASGTAAAREAVDLFVYRLAQEAAVMAAALGGVDGFVFTGGIGAHDPAVRAKACERLGWLGLTLDEAAATPGRVSRAGEAVEVWVMETDEEAVIARQTAALLA